MSRVRDRRLDMERVSEREIHRYEQGERKREINTNIRNENFLPRTV